MEIADHGWAFGQISDMKAWFDSLNQPGGVLEGKSVTVTGYSLGGHLATAFNQLMVEAGQGSRISATYTFNGAGVGEISDGNLTQTLDIFNDARVNGSEAHFQSSEARELYLQWRTELNGTASTERRGQALGAITDAMVALSMQPTTHAQALSELQILHDAMARASIVQIEAERVQAGIRSGADGSPAAQPVDPAGIEATKLDYQLAVTWAQEHTRPYASGILDGLGAAYAADRAPAALQGASPIYDIYGAPNPSAVANSQWHYGTPMPLYVEDQPLMRGTVVARVAWESLQFGEAKLLVDNFSRNDFGDTHSLVLLVDSLSVQTVLASLDPALSAETVNDVFGKATNLAAATVPAGQGGAEGDVLEHIVNWLGQALGVEGAALEGNPDGGTWAEVKDTTGSDGQTYSGREALHTRLQAIQDQIQTLGLSGSVKIAPAGQNLQSLARQDFGAYLALRDLSPFYLTGQDSAATEALNTTWQSVHGEPYLNWVADRQAVLYGDSGKVLDITDQWIADRAALLNAYLLRNQANIDDSRLASDQLPADRVLEFQYADPFNQTPEELLAWNSQHDIVGSPTILSDKHQRIAFGSEGNDTLEGTANALGDHLYGGAGSDTINGLGGDDWLEGNTGADTLDGGEGNDTLHGGAGMDRYEFSGDFGHDQVIDSDGSGTVWIDGAPLGSASGLVKVGENVWETQDRQLVLTHSTLGLIIGRRSSAGASTVDATIVVRNWQNGQLGIDLPQAPAPGHTTAPAGVFFLHGDQNISTDPVHKDKLDQVQPDGSWTYGTAAPGQDDFYRAGRIRQTNENGTPLRDADGHYIYVDRGRVEYDGRGGNDVIAGYQDNDTLKGGDGDDVIFGGAGSDVIHGGAGNDVIMSNHGGDISKDVSWELSALGITATPWLSGVKGSRPWSSIGGWWDAHHA